MTESPKAIVIGASSGIGAALAQALAGRGFQVALVARREDLLRQVAGKINDIAGRELATAFAGDVTEFASIPGQFAQILEELGGLDMIVYASGVTPKIGPNEYSFDVDKHTLEVNLLGAVAWLNLAAERFEKQKGGIVIGISSIAADRGRRGSPVYNTSKAGLDTYLEALRNRLSRYGVHVLTIRPGFVDTDSIKGMKLPPFPKPITAAVAARQTLDALDNHEQVRYVPGIWRVIGFILRHLPSPIMQKIKL